VVIDVRYFFYLLNKKDAAVLLDNLKLDVYRWDGITDILKAICEFGNT